MFKFVVLAYICGTSLTVSATDIVNIVGEPDYRKVRLNWELDDVDTEPNAFLVKYCEMQSWRPQRCRTQTIDNDPSNDIIAESNAKSYTADIAGLRMATTYLFEIKIKHKDQGMREDRSERDKKENTIVVPTKGFSAKATRCLPHSSEIEVATGPNFGGRIAVESSDGEKCAIDGDANSPVDTYSLRISHDECGSTVNETTVATFVIVQENLPILTHSARRFLVLCTYQPETLTVRAGINLPTNRIRGESKVTPQEQEQDAASRQGRNMRNARQLEYAEALVDAENHHNSRESSGKMITTLLLLLTVATLACCALFIRHIRRRNLNVNKNVLVHSENSACHSIDVEDISSLKN